MEKKKETKAQLERRIQNAVMFIPKDKDTESIFFEDKGVRITVTDDKAIIATGFHAHVFDAYNTAQGISRPYIYTKRILMLALENDCAVKDEKGNTVGYSYGVLLDTLSKKEDKVEYNIAYYYSWYLFNIFSPLYGVGETNAETFLTYFNYMCNIAKNAVLLAERTDDVTNKQFVEKFIEHLHSFTETMTEAVLFEKKSDEEISKENIDALRELELNGAVGNEQEEQRMG